MGYLGAKTGAGVYQAIIGLMPPHDTYAEPFAGSGAVFARKPAAAFSMLFDLNAAALDAIARRDNAEFYHGDGLTWLEGFTPKPADGRVLIYADPPYLHSTRTSRHRYKHEMTDADHERLCAALLRLHSLGVSVILSGYPNELYAAWLSGWNSKDFQAMTRGGVRTERLWFNFEPDAVHWASYAGKNFTDRQRIKRKAARWAAKFKALPAAERQAVLAALMDAAP